MNSILRSIALFACMFTCYSIATAITDYVPSDTGNKTTCSISSSVFYYSYGGDPQAVEITVNIYSNYQGDFNKYQWVYDVVNNSYNPYTFPVESNGFSGFLMYLDDVGLFEIDNIESPGPGWVIGDQYPLPINWDIASAAGIMPGGSGRFSFTTLPRQTVTVEGYFNTRYLGIPVKPVYFTEFNGPDGPGALKTQTQGACCFDDGSCSLLEESECASAGGVYLGDGTFCEACSPPGSCYLDGSCQPMQETNCNSAGGQFCENPKALLAGWPKWSDALACWADLKAAETQLKNQGWITERLPLNPNWADVTETINNDPCIRMLFMSAHGTPLHQIVFLSGEQREFKTPLQVAADLSNHNLDYLTVFLCFPGGWEQAFSGTIVKHNSSFIKGTTNGFINLRDILMKKHGVNMKPCSDSPQAFLLEKSNRTLEDGFPHVKLSADECPSFAICDSTGCGEEIYPVYSCEDSSGVASAGNFIVSSPDGMYEVAIHLPVEYTDTVICGTTYFQQVPDTLIHPTEIPLGRFLMFVDVENDSSVTADSISVVMKYLESDLTAAGIAHEEWLGVYFVTSDSPEFQNLSSALDTTANEIVFTVPQWGIAGIYEISEGTSVPNSRAFDCERIVLYQNYPNPFNPSTTISFALSKREVTNLSVYNIEGKLVKTLVDETLDSGIKKVNWDGKDSQGKQVSTGVYFYRLKAGGKVLTKKMVLLK